MRYLYLLSIAIFTLISTAKASVPPSVNVEIYTIQSCPGCEIAKSTLQARGIPYTEISLNGRRDLYRQMKERVYAALPASERRPMEESMTVPKIFINGKYVPNSDLDNHLDKITAINQGSLEKRTREDVELPAYNDQKSKRQRVQ